jgi:hypothetical protein
MNRLLFGDNLNWLRLACHPEPAEGSLPNASVVEPCTERSRRMVEALKKFFRILPMMACLAMMVARS